MSKAINPLGPVNKFLHSHNGSGHNYFLSHIDRKPIRIKQNSCFLSFIFYSAVPIVFLWRIRYILARFSPLLTLFSSKLPAADHAPNSASRSLLSIVFYFGSLAGDYHLVFNLLPFAKEFFTGHLWMRSKYGFRDEEIVFRRPTAVARKKLERNSAENGASIYSQNQERDDWAKQTALAIGEHYIDYMVGMWTGTEIWEVDYRMICDAYAALDARQIPSETWESGLWCAGGGANWRVVRNWSAKDTKALRDEAVRAGMEEIGLGYLHEELKRKLREKSGSGVAFIKIAEEVFAREGRSYHELEAKMTEISIRETLPVVRFGAF